MGQYKIEHLFREDNPEDDAQGLEFNLVTGGSTTTLSVGAWDEDTDCHMEMEISRENLFIFLKSVLNKLSTEGAAGSLSAQEKSMVLDIAREIREGKPELNVLNEIGDRVDPLPGVM